MRNHRLDRLARLTQGAALVGLGMTQLACSKDGTSPPAEPVHVNSPPMPRPEVDAAPPAALPSESPPSANAPPMAADAGGGPGVGRPTMNAPPRKLPPAPTAKP